MTSGWQVNGEILSDSSYLGNLNIFSLEHAEVNADVSSKNKLENTFSDAWLNKRSAVSVL